MSAHISRSRVVATGAAVFALAAVTGCGGTKEPSATAPAIRAPSGSVAPSGTAAPVQRPAGSGDLTKAGTTLKFGEVANVQVNMPEEYVGGLKVTALEKAPKSDYKALDVREDAGTVYYLRYDLTHISGKTVTPPVARDLVRLHPVDTTGQDISLVGSLRFSKCTNALYKADGSRDRDKEGLEIGEKATNMCMAYLVKKGELTGVTYQVGNYEPDTEQFVTWKK